jgi:diguanylate cyclase
MSNSADWDAQPGWLRWLNHVVLRQGVPRSVLLLTLSIAVLAVLISQGVISVLGHGDRLIAAASATLCALVLSPLVGTAVLRLVFSLEQARQKLAVLAIQDDLWRSSSVNGIGRDATTPLLRCC